MAELSARHSIIFARSVGRQACNTSRQHPPLSLPRQTLLISLFPRRPPFPHLPRFAGCRQRRLEGKPRISLIDGGRRFGRDNTFLVKMKTRKAFFVRMDQTKQCVS